MNNKIKLCLKWIIILGCLFRLVWPFIDNPLEHLFSDPARHWENAERFWNPSLMNGCDPLGYQIFLVFVQLVTLKNPILLTLVTGLLSCSMPWLYYRAARAFNIERNRALLLWALILWFPSFLVIYKFFMIESLLMPLIGLSLWMTARASSQKTMTAFLLMVVCWTLAALTKGQAIPMGIISCGYIWFKMDRKWRISVISISIITILLIPNALRTKSILGFSAPFGSSYIPRIMHASGVKHTRFIWDKGEWVYSSPSNYNRPLAPFSGWVTTRSNYDQENVVNIEKVEGRKSWAIALSEEKKDSKRNMKNYSDNIVLFLLDPSWPDSSRDTFLGRMNYELRWAWIPLIISIFIGNIIVIKNVGFKLVPILVIGTLLVFSLQNTVTMEGRYRKPIELLVIFNIIWISDRLAKMSSQKLRETA